METPEEMLQLLNEIAEDAAIIAKANATLNYATAARNAAIRRAMDSELPRQWIAKAAGLSEARLFQIRRHD